MQSRRRTIHHRTRIALAFCAVVAVASFALYNVVLAQDAPPDTFGLEEFGAETQLGAQDIRVTVARIIRAALGLLGIIAIGIVLYGGFVYMTAGGNEERVATAKKILINGAIGLVIILSSFAITQFILSRLGAATGVAGGVSSACADLTYALEHPLECSRSDFERVCETNPAICAAEEHFLVKSITPRTAGTGMNNVAIRAVFSRSVAGEANAAMRIFKDGTDVTSQFTFAFFWDKRSR